MDPIAIWPVWLSDIVGMPTGWATDDGRQVMAVGDRWYLELVPASRN